MRDHYHRATGQRPLHRGPDLSFASHVQGGERLIENQDFRILEQRPGDRDSLPLAVRERRAVLSDRVVVAIGQRAYEIVQPGCARRGEKLPGPTSKRSF